MCRSQQEFVTSLAHVLGTQHDVDLDPDLWLGGMARVGATQVSTSRVGVERYALAINEALDAIFADPTRTQALLGCDLSASGCLDSYIAQTGQRAWRRPLSLQGGAIQ